MSRIKILVSASAIALGAGLVMQPTAARAGDVCQTSSDGGSTYHLSGSTPNNAPADATACGSGAFSGGLDQIYSLEQELGLVSTAIAQMGMAAAPATYSSPQQHASAAPLNSAFPRGPLSPPATSLLPGQGAVCEVNGSDETLGYMAIGDGALACGAGAYANMSNSTAIGAGTWARWPDNTAVGASAHAYGLYSAAIGQYSQATGRGSAAMGVSAVAIGNYSLGLGTARAVGSYAVAIGYGAIAGDYYNPFDTAVGAGASADGYRASAFGSSAIASASLSSAIGSNSAATGWYSTAVGASSEASGDLSSVVGGMARATGVGSSAFGFFSHALGNSSTALGEDATASSDFSTAVGFNATVSASGATAMGANSVASGENSVAIGFFATDAGFSNSVAIGSGTANTADNQVALGGQTAATARTVTGVAAGTLSASSFEAVNGSQLYATNQDVAANSAAIGTLNSQVSGLQNDVTQLGDDMHRLDASARGGTAVAVALSGGTFLPDMKFNLTGNVGTYRGAYAAALQIGALVSAHVAVNAGVATGFNKNGKTAARVGFTLGW